MFIFHKTSKKYKLNYTLNIRILFNQIVFYVSMSACLNVITIKFTWKCCCMRKQFNGCLRRPSQMAVYIRYNTLTYKNTLKDVDFIVESTEHISFLCLNRCINSLIHCDIVSEVLPDTKYDVTSNCFTIYHATRSLPLT